MDWRVARSVLEALVAEAKRASPEECCGLLLGRAGVIEHAVPTANVAADPRRSFEIDPQALVDAHRTERVGGPKVLGYYHSHPNGPAEPSANDRAQSGGDGRVWAIAGAEGIAFWRDGEQGFERLSCDSIDG